MEPNEFLQGMAAFTESSLSWCSDEAMKATETVFDTMQTLQAMNQIFPDTEIPTAEGDIHNARLVCASQLQNVAQANKDVQVLVSPILQTLQFQDAITQQMQGLSKMLQTWIEIRTKLTAEGTNITDIEFGEKLIASTVSAEEVTEIRQHIPDLPEVEADDDDDIFF